MKISFLFYLLCLSDARYARKTSTSVLTNKRENVSHRSYVFGLKNLNTLSKIYIKRLCKYPRRCLEGERNAKNADCDNIYVCEEVALNGNTYNEFLNIGSGNHTLAAGENLKMFRSFFNCLDKIYSC